MSNDDRPPIHSYESSGPETARIFRKIDLYGSEVVCTVQTGKGMGDFNVKYDARTLANVLCDHLESQRPPEDEGASC